MLDRKKGQILQYFREELEERCVREYREYDQQLFDKLVWLRGIAEEKSDRLSSIE